MRRKGGDYELRIVRDQAKGLLGGVNFQLQAKVDLTDEESGLVNRYKADKEALLQKELSLFGRKLSFDLKIKDLIKGETFKCSDIADILATEDNVKEACKNFKTYLEVMRGFGGEETIEY